MSGGKDNVEFYLGDKKIARVESSMDLRKDDLINIRNRTYVVLGTSFSLDHANSFTDCALRKNVELGEIK